jgi:hypothetical protein
MKFLVAFALFAGLAGAQSTPLTGVWRVIEETTTGPGGKTITSPPPGILIFTEKYFSLVRIDGETPRPDLTTSSTDADHLAALDRLLAQSGTYEISGTTLIRHRIVAGVPNNMHPGDRNTASFKLEGKTLVITQLNNAKGQPLANPTTTKYTRVE